MLNSKVSIVERNFLDIKLPSIQCRLDYDRWKRYISQEFRYIEIQPIRFGRLSARRNKLWRRYDIPAIVFQIYTAYLCPGVSLLR